MQSVEGSVSLEGAHARLPVPPRPLIGRAREVNEARRLFLDEDARLVTLTGPGGVGKTRLAVAVALSVEDSFAEGVRFVDLAPVPEPGLLAGAIARACGMLHDTTTSPLPALCRALGNRNLLLLLDNCEHLLDAAPDVGYLLDTCRGLRVLATSREPLRLRSEWELPVLPLPLPTIGDPTARQTAAQPDLEAVDALSRNASVALFVQRARAVRPGFSLAPDNARAVAELCVRLDGLPLAIELAAARTRFVPPSAILARLEHPLDLQSPARDVPARHRTLREAIAWSYGLLSNDQQAVFRRLSVFAGGCSLESAERVCSPSLGPAAEPLFEILAALVERNLLLSEDSSNGEVRFRFLQTVREYAAELLEAMGEVDLSRAVHAEAMSELAATAERHLGGSQQRLWFDRLTGDLDNIRAALRWLTQSRQAADLSRAAAIAWSLWPFWWARGYLAEGRRWAEAILARPEASAESRARAAWVASTATLDQSEYAAAPPLIAECLALFRELDDARGLARALLVEGWAAPVQGDLDRALQAHQESAAQARLAGDELGVTLALAGLANTATLRRELDTATRFNAEALANARRRGDTHSQAQVLEALGVVALQQGEPARAEAAFRESVPLCLSVGSLELLCYCVVGLSGVALAQSQIDRAATLAGAAEGLRERTGLGVWPVRQSLEAEIASRIRQHGSPAMVEQAWRTGRELNVETVTALATSQDDSAASPDRQPALAALDVVPTVSHAADHQAEPIAGDVEGAGAGASALGLLTAREQEVAALIAAGQTSKQIADALVITERTADTHAAHIRDKLGLRSRAEIAAWAVRHGLVRSDG